MNNRYKFRAWSEKQKQMFYFTPWQEAGQEHFTEWQQFTGLLDKNGKEIYEGDILQIGPGTNFPVIWGEKNACFHLGTEHFYITGGQTKFYEIIGNIKENPELI